MTMETARTLKPGDKLTHNGNWAYRVGKPQTFTVLESTDTYIRVSNQSGFVSMYQWNGCSEFVTRDFFDSCSRV
jgi:hypothetical protein